MWGPERTAYQYSDLQDSSHIRILHLEDGEANTPLKCTIEHVDLDTRPDFIALSYVWGDPEKPYQMLVDDNHFVPLTESLNSVFYDIRACNGVEVKSFWADQICINQQNISEKNRQVAMMGDIYTKASGVVVYLGCKLPEDEPGLELLVELHRLFGHIESIDDEEHSEYLSQVIQDVPSLDHPGWKSMLALLQRDWVTRTWMLQEWVLNKSLRLACGSMLLPADVFEGMKTAMAYKGSNFWDDDYGPETGKTMDVTRFLAYMYAFSALRSDYPNSRT
jgi:hypothetical protein